MKDHRFSFVELILLVVVVLILAGFILPVVSKKRQKTSHPNCGGNLKMIGIAMHAYSSDNNGYFPVTAIGHNFEILDRFLKKKWPDSNAYGCPSNRARSTVAAKSDYWYVGSGLRDDNQDCDTVRVAFDRSGNHPNNDWMNAVFADGHVGGAKPDGARGWNDNDPKSILAFPHGKKATDPKWAQPGEQ